jgi:hypothetical protein
MATARRMDGKLADGWVYVVSKPTPLTAAGEQWGELSLRRLAKDRWILGGFLSSNYALG